MARDTIPAQVDSLRFAEHATNLHGVVLIKNLPRLCVSLANNEGEVEANIAFGIDDQRIPFIKGHIETRVILQCQRCMQPFVYGIICDFLSGIVSSEEEAEGLPDRYDPATVEDGMLSLHDRIEDELIVSLPLVPMHEFEDCKVKLPFVVAESPMESPFKVIESLKAKHKP